jgi:hypothetical protein
LGLVVNIIALWNAIYVQDALDEFGHRRFSTTLSNKFYLVSL